MNSSSQSQTAVTVGPLACTIDETATALRISKTTVYELFKENRLRKVKIGRRSLVPYADISAILADRHEENV
jgi:excisionase family DNA binding protein